jgi:hypothetical protein
MADISVLGYLVGAATKNVQLSSNTLVVSNLKVNLGTAFTFTFAGTITGNKTITMPDANVDLGAIATNATAISNLQGATGVSALASIDYTTNHYVTDGTSLLAAISALDAQVFTSAGAISDAVAAIGSASLAAVNYTSNNYITDGTSLVAAASALDVQVAANTASIAAVASGYQRRKKVDSIVANPATTYPGTGLPAASTGQRYIVQAAVSANDANWGGNNDAFAANDIIEYNGTKWIVSYSPIEGTLVYVDNVNVDALFVDDGSPAWEIRSVLSSALAQDHIFVGNASGIATDVAMSGEASIVASGAITLSNSAVIGKVLTAIDVSTNGTVAATDSILAAIGKLAANTVDLTTLSGSAQGAVDLGTGFQIIQNNRTIRQALGDLDTQVKANTDAIASSSAAIVSKSAVMGENLPTGDKTYAVRWAVNGETAGRLYLADKDFTGAPTKYRACGVVQAATSPETAGASITLYQTATLSLKANDTNFAAADQGKEIFLQESGLIGPALPEASGTSGEEAASVVLGYAKVYNATVTSSTIEICVTPGSFKGTVFVA